MTKHQSQRLHQCRVGKPQVGAWQAVHSVHCPLALVPIKKTISTYCMSRPNHDLMWTRQKARLPERWMPNGTLPLHLNFAAQFISLIRTECLTTILNAFTEQGRERSIHRGWASARTAIQLHSCGQSLPTPRLSTQKEQQQLNSQQDYSACQGWSFVVTWSSKWT